MTTALITHADCLEHVTPDGHPERVARLEHVLHALQTLDLHRVTAREATDEEIRLVHPQRYIDRIVAAEPAKGVTQLDADTWMSPGSVRAARLAAGAGIQAVDMVMGGEVQNAFCATRPPGHHAETETPMGFCLFGTAALAAKHALDVHGLERVAVVDFDVHHGNGTQDLLWNEARSLFITSQQMPLWPGTGRPEERGAHDNVMNLPLPPDSGGAEMRARYEKEAFPRLRDFAPELLIISAGFDAHQDDPLANLNWTVDDFRWVTRALCDIARETAGGRVVSTLEGGYDLAGLSASAKAHVEVLMEAGA
ncbi:histone deacetylase family protein [Sagittula sp. MA-2]|jgi:acetoin utilization deacetylase AcuC-like enzyme|uniref:histone deacetylase family protein n=1 Tax=Sagittula sp. MA-2 TaxID=3048007 RepID=UPI0024C2C3C5|nr:histone deacetylase family protein [Sagittula sp. MA-2]WHZ36241.1 histone deacetylase family protein [Sagittula sp. MA-2]